LLVGYPFTCQFARDALPPELVDGSATFIPVGRTFTLIWTLAFMLNAGFAIMADNLHGQKWLKYLAPVIILIMFEIQGVIQAPVIQYWTKRCHHRTNIKAYVSSEGKSVTPKLGEDGDSSLPGPLPQMKKYTNKVNKTESDLTHTSSVQDILDVGEGDANVETPGNLLVPPPQQWSDGFVVVNRQPIISF